MYNLIFRGEILPGHDVKDVETAFADLFGVKRSRIRPYFKGKKIFVKKGMDLAKAKRYKKVMHKIGVKCYFDPPLPVEQTSTAGHIVCEHCGTRQTIHDTCRNCGISFAKFRAFKARLGGQQTEDMTMTLDYITAAKKDPNRIRKQRAVAGVQIAAVLLIVIFLVDFLLQLQFIDITRYPYLVPLLGFCFGFYYLAQVKGYPKQLAMLGVTSFLGLAVMMMLRNRNAENQEYLFKNHRLLPVVLILGFSIWGGFQIEKMSEKMAFLDSVSAIGRIRSDYPTSLIETDKRAITRMQREMEGFVKRSLQMVKEIQFRPNDVSLIGEIVFNEVSKYFIWLQYQRFLHAKTTKYIPAFLSDKFIQDEIKKYRLFFDSTVPKIENARLDASFRDWVAGLSLKDNSDLTNLRKDLIELRTAILAYMAVKQQLPVSWDLLLAQRPDIAHMMDSIHWDTDGTITVSTHFKGRPPEDTVVMAYYKHPDNDKLMYTRIGGTLPDKYMGNSQRVLSHSYAVGVQP